MILKNIRETPLDRALAKVQKYLRDNALIVVPFDKGVGFFVMKKSTHAEKLEKILDQKRAASTKVLLKNLDNQLLPSVIFVLRNRVRNHVVHSERRLRTNHKS